MKHLLFSLLALIISLSCYALGPITGPSALCAGSADTLTDATTGGAWSSSAPGVAAVGSGTGLVTGIAPGTATITYTLGGKLSNLYDYSECAANYIPHYRRRRILPGIWRLAGT
jgi:hypothetical protein